jgi:hypothetical protein
MALTDTNSATEAAADGFNASHLSTVPILWLFIPTSLLATVEGQFYLDLITDKKRKYYMFLITLIESTLDFISDKMEESFRKTPTPN